MGSYEKVNGVANHDTCKECLMSIYHVTKLPMLFLVIYYVCVLHSLKIALVDP